MTSPLSILLVFLWWAGIVLVIFVILGNSRRLRRIESELIRIRKAQTSDVNDAAPEG